MRISTSVLLLGCLIFAGLGLIGDQQIHPLSWNTQIYNTKQHNTTQNVYNYELKPWNPEDKWRNPPDVYDVSASMTDRFWNVNETREFLKNHNCENQLPTPINVWLVVPVSNSQIFNFQKILHTAYSVSTLACTQ